MIGIYFSILFIGLILVNILIVIGSIASKKFNFSFSYLIIFSLGLYLGISYVATKLLETPIAGVSLVGIIGLYETTIGIKLVIKFGANLNDLQEDLSHIFEKGYKPSLHLLSIVILIYMIIGWLGVSFAQQY